MGDECTKEPTKNRYTETRSCKEAHENVASLMEMPVTLRNVLILLAHTAMIIGWVQWNFSDMSYRLMRLEENQISKTDVAATMEKDAPWIREKTEVRYLIEANKNDLRKNRERQERVENKLDQIIERLVSVEVLMKSARPKTTNEKSAGRN